MNITPIDIQQKRFHVIFRGFEQREVETFLDQVREEMEALMREAAELREFRQVYDDRMSEVRQKEETVKNTMVMTQRLMEDQKDNARREAALVIKDAEIRSQQIIASVHEQKLKLEADIQNLKRMRHHFLEDVKKVVQMHLEMVNFEEGSDAAKEEPAQG
jgi:cell division initiation protein